MAQPHKGFKSINHRDTHYRWIMRNLRGVNELVVEMSAPVNGQQLIAELPRVVSLKMVTDGIDFAHENGWTPEASAPPFRCKYQGRGFRMETL